MRHHWKTVYFQLPQTLHSRGLSAKTSTNPQSPVFPRTWYRRSPSHGHPPCVVISPLHPQVFTVTNGGSQLSHFLNPTQPLTEWTQLSQFPAWSLINGSIIYTMQFLTSYMKAPYILRRMALNLFTSERWTDSKILTSEKSVPRQGIKCELFFLLGYLVTFADCTQLLMEENLSVTLQRTEKHLKTLLSGEGLWKEPSLTQSAYLAGRCLCTAK